MGKYLEKKENNKNVNNWYPGHMKKATNQIIEKLKLVDFIIFILDSRVPYTSFNSNLNELIKNKRKLIIFNKIDLADLDKLNLFIDKNLNKENDYYLLLNLSDNSSKEKIFKKIDDFSKEKLEKLKNKGIKHAVTRALVLGIPNVGKSTFINMIAPKNIQKVQNMPGVTRNITWVKINKNFEMIDSPGILEPRFKDANSGIKLSLIGSVKEGIINNDVLAEFVLNFLKNNYLEQLLNYLNLKELPNNNEEILKNIAVLRGFLLKNNEYDIEKAKVILLKDFKNGKISKVFLYEVK